MRTVAPSIMQEPGAARRPREDSANNREFRTSASSGIPRARGLVRVGAPEVVVLSVAEETEADLVILGWPSQVGAHRWIRTSLERKLADAGTSYVVIPF